MFPKSVLQCHQPVSSAQTLGLTHTWAVCARAHELGEWLWGKITEKKLCLAVNENSWEESVSADTDGPCGDSLLWGD